MCPRRATSEPENSPDQSDHPLDDGDPFISAVSMIEKNIDYAQSQRDQHGRHTRENEELGRRFDTIGGGECLLTLVKISDDWSVFQIVRIGPGSSDRTGVTALAQG